MKQSQPTKLISKILKYRKTHTLAETGKKFNLSSERIRQLEFSKHKKRCKVHNRLYYNKCSYCLIHHYKKYVNYLDDTGMALECRIQSKNTKRDYLSVSQKAVLVKRLHDVKEVSFGVISKLLIKRHISSIKNLYKHV